MAGVFISYRRADSQAWADRLADSLILRFGGGLIWRDVDDIPAGEPWPAEIRKALAAADAVLVLIGPDWLDNPRLTERRDVLRHEIQTALRSKASVVPLLVGGAAIPEPSKLPRAIRSLATLAKRQGLTLRDGWYWRDDVNVLLVELRRIVGNRRHSEPLKRLYEKLGQFQGDYFSVLAKPAQALDVARQTLALLDDQTPHYPHEPILQIVRGYTYKNEAMALRDLNDRAGFEQSLGRAEAVFRAMRAETEVHTAAAYNGLGSVEMLRGRMRPGKAWIKRALRLWPDYPEALQDLQTVESYLAAGGRRRRHRRSSGAVTRNAGRR